MEFKEYLAIIRRRWLLFFPIFVLIVGAHLVWINYGQHTRYAATSKVIITEDKGIVSNATALVPVGMHGISFGTKEATITDYPILKRAAELALGRLPFLSNEFQGEKMRAQIELGVQSAVAEYGNGDDGVERLTSALQRCVAADPEENREIVEIKVEGDDGLKTLLYSWAMAEGASQFHRDKARANIEQYTRATDERLSAAQRELANASSELHSAQRSLGITNFAEKERMIIENLYRIEREEDQLIARSRKTNRLIEHRLQTQSFDGRRDIGTNIQLESEGRAGEIRQMLFEQKLALDTKVSTLSPKHPEVHELRAKIAGLERAMAKEQDSVLAEKYAAFSRETNDFIKENALVNLELEVLGERKKRLNDDLLALNALRQEFVPKEERHESAQELVGSLADLRKQLTWLSEGSPGTVLVYDPAVSVNQVIVGGHGFGPLSLTLLMAFIFALGVVYVVEYVDTRMKSESDIRRHLNLPLLGIIPREPGTGCLLIDAPPQSEIAEKFNTAATLIQTSGRELDLRALMVCSAIAREGKTTVSVNLAVALARKCVRVVLIDGDLRISQIHNVMRLPNHVGLSTVLDPRVDPAHIIEGVMTDADLAGGRPSAVTKVQRTQIETLDVLTSGPPTADPVTLLDATRLQRLVAELKQHYDFVIFDTPPINKVGDALTIASVVDGCVFVVGSGQAEQHDVTWAKHLLSNVQANILGVFLNKYSKQRGSEYYYYYYNNDRKRRRVKSRA